MIPISALDSQIIIQSGGLHYLAEHLSENIKEYSQIILFSTPSVLALYGCDIEQQLDKLKIPFNKILVQDGEQTKTLACAASCWKRMTALRTDRHSLVLALGGGTLTDLAGFVAACYMRGLDTVLLPTTLMGMIDAAIGGKTGINMLQHKNHIGAFHHPKLILIDPYFLKTLPGKEFSAGFAEMIKYAMIGSPSLFEDLERHIELIRENLSLLEEFIHQCCIMKANVVCSDPKDQDRRAILNYGHTFAHAIESLTHYQSYSHGEAVSIGMSCAAHLSCLMNKIDFNVVKRQDDLCLRAGLPIRLQPLSIDRLLKFMQEDKKAKGCKINLILPQEIGKVIKVLDVNPDLIRQTLQQKIDRLP